MKTIGLAPNPHKENAVELASELADWLIERGIEVRITEETAGAMGKQQLGASDEQVMECHLLVVLGGDGSMLRWSRMAAPKGLPMMGVNFGQYGFITEVHPDQAKSALAKILAGEYSVSERVGLNVTVTRNGTQVASNYGLNDVVVSKGDISRMLGLKTYVGNKYIVTYAADGIIVASPTGSTAYSLSAGGPVVHPDVCVLVITPICPHTLNVRSLVVPDSESVQIVSEGREDDPSMVLAVDGQLREHITGSDVVEIRRADFTAKLVQFGPQTFYNKLQTRLRWGERFSN